MLTIRDHGVEDYAALPDMDGTDVDVLGEDDRACLEELGQYLAATDASQRFGIWLLHKHFQPAAGEVFVERAIRAPRKTETTPIAPDGGASEEMQRSVRQNRWVIALRQHQTTQLTGLRDATETANLHPPRRRVHKAVAVGSYEPWRNLTSEGGAVADSPKS